MLAIIATIMIAIRSMAAADLTPVPTEIPLPGV